MLIYIYVCDSVHSEVVEVDNKNNIGNDVIGKALRTRHLMSIIECEDANGNTPLSEAASESVILNFHFFSWICDQLLKPR